MTRELKIVHYSYGLFVFLLQCIFLAVSIILKPFVYLLVKIQYGDNIKPCTTSLDVILGMEDSGSRNISLSLKIKGIPNYEKILARWGQMLSFQTNLGPDGKTSPKYYSPYDRFQWIGITKYFFCFFKKDDKFNLKNHVSVRHFNTSEPYDTGRFRSLLDAKITAVCEYYAGHTFSKNKPGWEVVIVAAAPLPLPHDSGSSIDKMYPDSEYGLIFVWNHIYMDGVSALQMLRHTIADNIFPMTVDPMKTPTKKLQKPSKSTIEKIKTFLKLVATTPHGFASMVLSSAQERHIFKIRKDKKINSKRFCHWIEYDLKKLKAVNVPSLNVQQKEIGNIKVRLNTLILASVTKAYETIFKNVGAKIPENIQILIASAPLPYKSLTALNGVVTTNLRLPLRTNSRAEMIQTVEDIIVEATTEENLKANQMMIDACGSLISPFLRFLQAKTFTAFTCVSNAIGTEDSFTVFGGDLVTSVFALPTIICNDTVNIVTLNYNHKLFISVTADESIVNRIPGLPQQLLECVRDELDCYVRESK